MEGKDGRWKELKILVFSSSIVNKSYLKIINSEVEIVNFFIPQKKINRKKNEIKTVQAI